MNGRLLSAFDKRGQRGRASRGPGQAAARPAKPWRLMHSAQAWLLRILLGACGAFAPAELLSAEPANEPELLRGRVAWLDEVLQSNWGIPSDPDARHTQIVLLTAAGRLHPLVKDGRGRAFWIDPRLHERDLEIQVRRHAGHAWVQVLRVYSWHADRRYELDYWCDVCAIPMYERKACECCQGETRIRERWVDDPLVEWNPAEEAPAPARPAPVANPSSVRGAAVPPAPPAH